MRKALGVRPRFSVVIPIHDRADVVGRAIASVLTQTLASLEVIVVDSGLGDASDALAATIGDRRVRVVHHDTDEAECIDAARYTGIGVARGTWLTTLDPDDEVNPGWLARLGRLAESSGAALVSCGGEQHHDGCSVSTIVPTNVVGLGDDVNICLRPGGFAARRRDLIVLLDGHRNGIAPTIADLCTELAEVLVVEGRRIAATPEALVQWNEPHPEDSLDEVSEPLLRWNWAVQVLDALARTPIPDEHLMVRAATVGAIAAVELGEKYEARRLFRLAWQAERSARTCARYAVASVMPLAQMVWATPAPVDLAEDAGSGDEAWIDDSGDDSFETHRVDAPYVGAGADVA